MTCAPVEVGAWRCSLADAPAHDAPAPPRRQAENDLNEALSSLSSAAKQEALQLALMQRAQHDAPQPDAVRSLEAMGFGADAARRALVVTHGDVEGHAGAMHHVRPSALHQPARGHVCQLLGEK